MRYTVTVLDENDVAIDVLYCGQDWLTTRAALDFGRGCERLRGKRIRIVQAADDGEVVRIQDTAVH